jgi:hypothetical protein
MRPQSCDKHQPLVLTGAVLGVASAACAVQLLQQVVWLLLGCVQNPHAALRSSPNFCLTWVEFATWQSRAVDRVSVLSWLLVLLPA